MRLSDIKPLRQDFTFDKLFLGAKIFFKLFYFVIRQA